MKLEISWSKGKKEGEDRVYKITTKTGEPITIFKLALLTNQLAFNEVEIKKKWLDIETEVLYFEDFIRGAIIDAKKGINWAEPKNEAYVIEQCKKYYLPREKIDFDLLRRTQQRVLEEFGRPARDRLRLSPSPCQKARRQDCCAPVPAQRRHNPHGARQEGAVGDD